MCLCLFCHRRRRRRLRRRPPWSRVRTTTTKIKRDLSFVYGQKKIFWNYTLTIPSFGYPIKGGWRRTRPAGSHLRRRALPWLRAAPLCLGSSSNSHLRDDAQFIDFTPTNTARTPAAREDLGLLASQPNSPSDNSQFQLTQQQAMLSKAQQQLASTQQQQPPIRMASSASPPLNPTGPSPSSFTNNPFSRPYPVSSSNAPTSPHLGVAPVFPATLHPRYPRAYAAYKAGDLATQMVIR